MLVGIVIDAARLLARRHATVVAAAVLVLSLAGTVAALLASRFVTDTPHVRAADLVYVGCQILPYGVVGAVLVARRPDLLFGWLLSLSAMSLVTVLAVTGPSLVALEHGQGGQPAVWGLAAGSLLFVPAAIEGLINVRFPSGSPSGRSGRLLERAIIAGIVVGIVSGLLGDSVIGAVRADGGPERFIDGTPLVPLGNALVVAVPLVILPGSLRGHRRGGPLPALGGSPAAPAPLARGGSPYRARVLPAGRDRAAPGCGERRGAAALRGHPRGPGAALRPVGDRLDRASLRPLHLRLLRRRRRQPGARDGGDAAPALSRSPGRATALLATFGEPTGETECWPLVHEGDQVGQLLACPRHGFTSCRRPSARCSRRWRGWWRARSAPRP
ncbi:hypothetical protein [Nocardioides sp.]|uniref:hypothetical protein n=1 Tax=Nocardioides sp. TaxID=35761 RepID=UPI0035288D59